MKTTIATFSMLLLVFFSLNTTAKGKDFTGKITYKISFDSDDIPEQAKAMLPKTMTLYIGKGFTKSELFTQMGSQSSIEDLNAKTKTALLDLMGQKFAMTDSAEDIAKELLESPETDLEYTGEEKEIAGYMCEKVIAKSKENGEEVATAWITDDIEVHENMNFSNTEFRNLKGVMLEFDSDMGNGMQITFTAIEVDKQKLKKDIFDVPAEYKKTTREELQNTFGG
jgi:GLPGLI family protein